MSTLHESQVPSTPIPPEDAYQAAARSPEFQDLRRRFRRFVFPVTILGLTWYAAYVVLADYAHAFMARKLLGNITVGLVLGLSQFAMTFLVTVLYVRFATRELDPRAERLRAQVEGEVR